MDSKTQQPQSDRISRAWAIIETGEARYLQQARKFIVTSQTNPDREYDVFGLHCECRDSQRGHLCKHVLASTGELVTLACVSFREAASADQLREFGLAFAPKFADLPHALMQLARDEYRRQLTIFREAERNPALPLTAAA